MKHLKISMVAFIAIVMGMAVSAFNVKDTKLTDGWFTIQNPSAPDNAASYMYYGASSPCSGSTVLCAMELRRLGMANKLLLIGLKSQIPQLYEQPISKSSFPFRKRFFQSKQKTPLK